ncbi:tyrosine/serine protein phosphatase [Poronia punctata]|nr:tyrosine/serine protein phosphatase [Poronia punctata]
MSIEFENIVNFRDVGKTVNDYLGKRVMREGVLFRSARPDEATLQDRRRLVDELGIKTVMDLRTKTEHLNQAKKRQEDMKKPPALLQSNPALAEPVEIPGLSYHYVRVTGRRFERFLLGQLSWLSFFRLLFLFIFGYRLPAIQIMAQEVMRPLGLVGLSLVTLDESKPEILEVPRPTLVHCTQGKDRTGMIIALVLLALRVPPQAVAHDYLLSQAGIEPEREARLVEILEIGLTPAWLDCPPEMIDRVRGHLDVRYGGVDGYLDSIGFQREDRMRLIEVFGA